ncbi:YitT family protein ['Cynodon dactylon' phytoplasma]|uniref:YitT family protein n=1 Tax='Cynodon dactylon' phytoplasma TaxID=295320 RepID=UPI001265B730|nr:YitT family protein ['Cynodon dactylon' phytoplasma]KAB8121825.1 YitT family protein ['Cynodon dactylon' phytoplasma]
MDNKKKFLRTLTVLFFLILFFLIFSNNLIIKKIFFNKFIQILLSICLLIFNVYFFILPENFIIGGLESNLIFLDKIFFYHKKKQNYFFSKNNHIIIIRILIISIFGYLMRDIKYFFITTIMTNLFFAFVIKIFEYYKIERTFFIDKMPYVLKNNLFLKMLFLSIIIGISVGLSCGCIFLNNGSTGGTDVIFAFIRKIFKLKNLKLIFFMTDGLMIIFSFFVDLKRKIDKRKNIFLKYIFSFITFIIAILLIDIVLKY